MRVWLVIGALAVIVGVTLAVRTRAGWEPTELERLDILCDRGLAANCTLLGLRLLEKNPGADETKRGLEKLGRGCNLGDSNGCYLHGSHALRLRGPDAAAVAASAFAKGCALRHQDSCAYAGWLKRHAPKEQRDLSGGRTLLVGACGNGSALGCTWLGEIALRLRDRSRRAASSEMTGAVCARLKRGPAGAASKRISRGQASSSPSCATTAWKPPATNSSSSNLMARSRSTTRRSSVPW